MKIEFKDYEHYNLITECDHKDLPIIPNVGDWIWLNGVLRRVARREFYFNDSKRHCTHVAVYVTELW